jgi:hypothetical protein
MASKYDTKLNFAAPALPVVPSEYEVPYFDNYNEILRLYFSQTNEALRVASAQEYSESTAWFFG